MSENKIDIESSSDYDDDPNEMLADCDTRTPQQVLKDIYTNLFNALFSDNNYGSGSYWDERYKEGKEEYEWFLSWDQIFPKISSYLHFPIEKCLNLGCGNSLMSRDMLKNDIKFITNIDISETVIQQMKETNEDEARLEWLTMDCTKLSFENNTFDFVVDKGTIDALYCCDDAEDKIEKTVKEIERVLKSGGGYICISYGDRNIRSFFLQTTQKFMENRAEEKVTINDNKTYFAYIFIKK